MTRPSVFSRRCNNVLTCVAFWLATTTLRAEVKLPAIISDHMVIQADVAVPIWGWGVVGEVVHVSLGESKVEAKTDADGRWQASLPKRPAGGPWTLTVTGTNSIVVHDILVGEVWLGSGQSNMAMTVNRVNDYEQESKSAKLPKIRMFTVTSGPNEQAQSDCRGSWAVCSPEAVGLFSATAFFFSRELHRELNVPIGIIHSSVGGTAIESWISPDAQAASPDLKPFFTMMEKANASFDATKAKAKYERDLAEWQDESKKAKAGGKAIPKRPQDPIALRERKGNIGGLFNGKIAPLTPYRIRGALWYQGEANSTANKAEFYQYQLPLLIRDWRTRWGYEFPMAWVQLPNFNGPGREWPVVREAMLKTLEVPNTGMAITIDIGDPKDIHPKNKQDVGKRLAMWALGDVYGKSIATSGPIPAGQARRGNSIAVKFRHTDGGLVAKGSELAGFEIADANGFKTASAKIVGDEVVISHNDIREPAAVRYAWENNPTATLYNGAGLPASPFRVSVK